MRPLVTALLFAGSAICQQPLAFEVASIKLQPWTGRGRVGVFVSGDTLHAEHATLNDLVSYAYNLEDFQLSGGPGWAARGKLVESTLFEVIAKPAPSDKLPTEDQFRKMLQALLADRCHLEIHHVSKEFPTYDLVVNRGGLKMKESATDTPFQMHISSPQNGSVRIVAAQASMTRLTGQVGLYAGRPVFDKTGLSSAYDFTLDFVPENRIDADSGESASIFTALKDQLGLRLEPSKAPFDTVVIDHAEKPSGN